ncbi:alpha/beta fold hydrolase [Streptomyces sparsogenes]|uniref:alpha/beta fold hydrolase n=1 Tax=Streptomyces sparsogenes TaxID=67365 RepID=UPI0033F821C5
MELSVPVDDGVKLNVRYRPGEDGRPFLLLHGLGSNARMWDEVADRLAAAGHPAYAADMRGHGGSDTPEHGYDNATAVADIVTLCRELGLKEPLIAGHSWGGNLAVRALAQNPGLCAGLGLVDGGWVDFASIPGFAGYAEHAQLRRPDATGTTRDGMRLMLRGLHPTWSDAAIEASLADMVEGPDGLLVQRLPLQRFLPVFHSMCEDPPARWYPGVTVPVLLLNALPPQESWWSTNVRRWVAKAEAAIPQAESRWYLDADHNLHADDPERLAGDLLDLARTVEDSKSLDEPLPERS